MIPFRKKIHFHLSEQEFYQRKELQTKKTMFEMAAHHIFVENFSLLFKIFKFFLGRTKWYEKGMQNALNVQILNHAFYFSNLPSAFDKLKILHLSDLHINHQPELTEVLTKKIALLDFDLCVITGDIHHKNYGDFEESITLLQKIVPHLVKARYGVFAVLGNHDFVEMVAEMEKIGIQVLINETVILEKDNQALYLTGIDELLYQKKEGFDRKLFKLDKKNFNIFATHSPEFITLVAPNYSLYLCGHTHGGQICLPNGKLIVLNTGAPLAFCQGKWKFLNMQGYTSSGAGTSGLPVRFHCPSEISIHQLHRK